MIDDDLRAMSPDALDEWLAGKNAEVMMLRRQMEAIEQTLRVGYRVLRERLIRATT